MTSETQSLAETAYRLNQNLQDLFHLHAATTFFSKIKLCLIHMKCNLVHDGNTVQVLNDVIDSVRFHHKQQDWI